MLDEGRAAAAGATQISSSQASPTRLSLDSSTRVVVMFTSR